MHRLSARHSSPTVPSPVRVVILMAAAAGLSLTAGCTSPSQATSEPEGFHGNIREIERIRAHTFFVEGADSTIAETWKANFDDKLWYINCGAETPDRVRVVRCQGEHSLLRFFWPASQTITPGSLSNTDFTTAQFGDDNAFVLYWLNDDGKWVVAPAIEGNANFELKDRGAGIRFSWVRPGCFVDLHCK